MADAVAAPQQAPPAASTVDERRWLIALVLMAGIFLDVLDTTIVNVGIPHMMSTFGSTIDQIEWVSTGYMLAMALVMPLTGYLANVVGTKRLFLGSLTLFTLFSTLCGLAWSTEALVAFRILQGTVGGVLNPVAQAIFARIFPREEQGRALGVLLMPALLAPVIGPTLGGVLVQAVSWRCIFLINIPVGIAGLLAGLVLMRESPRRRVPLDVPGASTLSLFLGTTLLALSQAHSKGWGSPYILGLLFTGALAFVAFLAAETWRDHDPIVKLALFANPAFTAGCCGMVANGVALFGGLFLLPVFVQQLMGYDAYQTGLMLVPGGLAVFFFIPIGGKLADKLPLRGLALVGMGIMALGLYLTAGITPRTSYASIAWWQILRGAGSALALPAINKLCLGYVAPGDFGQASGLSTSLRQLGGSFGIAALTAALTQRQVYHLALLGPAASRQVAGEALGRLAAMLVARGADPGFAHQQGVALMGAYVAREAAVRAFQDTFLVAAALTVLCLVPVLLMRPGAPGSARPPAH